MDKISFFVLVKLIVYEYQLSIIKNMFVDFLSFKEFTENKLQQTLPIERLTLHSQMNECFLKQEIAYIFQRLEYSYAIDYPWHARQNTKTIYQLYMLTQSLFKLERRAERINPVN